MRRVEQDNLVYYEFAMWPGIKHGVFTRLGGVSPAPWASLNMGGNVGDSIENVRQNHELMFEALQLNASKGCTVWQVHSADVVIANAPRPNRRWLAQADGILTDRLDLPLTMRFADCTPIFLLDPVRGVIGLAHAGWRGTVQGVAAQTVRTMGSAFGCRPQDIQAGIGPSIGQDRYQVGLEVTKAIHKYFGLTTGLIRTDPTDGTFYLDLWAANQLDLQQAGVDQIEIAGLCTAANTHEFFSHRAESGRTGRFGAVLSLS
ncbi:MAG: peptidoglycan editing factor PgeF [Anaerolineae bacterium]|nr:peptidoglycan editing factor PgeF [Anaerolineae bacterium]